LYARVDLEATTPHARAEIEGIPCSGEPAEWTKQGEHLSAIAAGARPITPDSAVKAFFAALTECDAGTTKYTFGGWIDKKAGNNTFKVARLQISN
jgi:hypothetical protein